MAPDNSNLPLNIVKQEAHMKSKKTKSYIVTCEVDMCAEHEVDVPVRATKESLACKKAKEALLNSGYFIQSHADVKR